MRVARTHWPVFLALLCGLLLTAIPAYWAHQEQVRQREQAQIRLASRQAELLEHRLNVHAEVLRGLQGVLLTHPDLSHEALLRIVEQQNVLIRHPGFVSIVRLRGDEKHLSIEHVYPRNIIPELVASPEMTRTFRQVNETHRGLLSPAFVPPGQQRPHVLLIFPAQGGGVAMLYRLDLLGATLGMSSQIRGWRLSDRGSVSDRGAKINIPLLLDRNPHAGKPGDHASALVNLPGRQWLMEVWAAPPTTSETAERILALGLSMTLLLTLFLLVRLHRNRPSESPALLQETHPLVRAVTGSPDVVVLRDGDGRIVFANAAAQTLLGEDHRSPAERRDALLVSAELGRLDAPLYCEAERRERYYEVLLLPLPCHEARQPGTAMFARDRTRHHAELDRLQARLARYEKMQGLLSEFFWEQDAQGRFTHVGGALLTQHTLTAQYFIGKTLRELGMGGLDESAWQSHQHVRDERQAFHDLAYVLEIDHAPLHLRLSGLPKFEANGDFCGYYGIGRDVSAIRRSQDQLQGERQRIIATLESISDGIITTGLDGRIDYLNPVACALTGWESADALGQPVEHILQVVEPQSRLPLSSLLRRVLQTGRSPQSHRCGILLNRFGLGFLIQEAVACVHNEQGDVIGAVVVFRDLTDWNTAQASDGA